jgi:hypothetical protein
MHHLYVFSGEQYEILTTDSNKCLNVTFVKIIQLLLIRKSFKCIRDFIDAQVISLAVQTVGCPIMCLLINVCSKK